MPAWIEKEGLLERCELIDVSEKGARLNIGDVYQLPNHFKLHFAIEPKTCQHCTVIWRRDNQVGVEFAAR